MYPRSHFMFLEAKRVSTHHSGEGSVRFHGYILCCLKSMESEIDFKLIVVLVLCDSMVTSVGP